MNISIVIPAKNEEQGLTELLPKLKGLDLIDEIVVVDDGSTDGTVSVCKENEVVIVSHPYSRGNGAAIKSGARKALGEWIVFMDADGQHRPEDIIRLIDETKKGHDLVVGAREGLASQANLYRNFANIAYNKLASWVVGKRIDDLTSGFRLVRAEYFRQILYLLPNGFSYPTTSTMAFFRLGYSVSYIPISVKKREGKSHINIVRDGLKFLLIIFRVGTLYSPLKIYFPVASLVFMTGVLYYAYTYWFFSRFTNMSAVMFLTALIIFMIGLISEQITMLLYKESSK